MRDLSPLPVGSIKAAIESLLLVSTEAVSAMELARVLGIAPGEAEEALADLSAEYSDTERGIQLREVAGGWRLFTHPAYHEQVADYVRSWDARRLSQAALETLAVIAYHQPVARDGVKAVRGVNSDGVIASLKEKGLVKEVGHERGGRAVMYGTTRTFLERFGLRSLDDLPPLEEFAPDEESKQFIRERLSGKRGATLEEAADDLEEERELLDDSSDSAANLVDEQSLTDEASHPEDDPKEASDA